MDLGAFKSSLTGNAPPEGTDRALQALWHEAKGDWAKAHRLAQGQKDDTGAWVHAYLHRVEGDDRQLVSAVPRGAGRGARRRDPVVPG